MMLTKTQIEALEELERFERRMTLQTPYWWRQASMRVLAERGFVCPWHPTGKRVKIMAHRLTDGGREFLAGFPK